MPLFPLLSFNWPLDSLHPSSLSSSSFLPHLLSPSTPPYLSLDIIHAFPPALCWSWQPLSLTSSHVWQWSHSCSSSSSSFWLPRALLLVCVCELCPWTEVTWFPLDRGVSPQAALCVCVYMCVWRERVNAISECECLEKHKDVCGLHICVCVCIFCMHRGGVMHVLLCQWLPLTYTQENKHTPDCLHLCVSVCVWVCVHLCSCFLRINNAIQPYYESAEQTDTDCTVRTHSQTKHKRNSVAESTYARTWHKCVRLFGPRWRCLTSIAPYGEHCGEEGGGDSPDRQHLSSYRSNSKGSSWLASPGCNNELPGKANWEAQAAAGSPLEDWKHASSSSA